MWDFAIHRLIQRTNTVGIFNCHGILEKKLVTKLQLKIASYHQVKCSYINMEYNTLVMVKITIKILMKCYSPHNLTTEEQSMPYHDDPNRTQDPGFIDYESKFAKLLLEICGARRVNIAPSSLSPKLDIVSSEPSVALAALSTPGFSPF